MENRIERFLKSIGLSTDNFDLNFNSINKENDGTWNFEIIKDTSWNYYPLIEFIDALNNIKYKYKICFAYKKVINTEDVLKLFDDFYFESARMINKNEIKNVGNVFSIQIENLSNKKLIDSICDDFNKLLNFISYDFRFTYDSKVAPKKEEKEMTSAIKEEIAKIEEEKESKNETVISDADQLFLDEYESKMRYQKMSRDRKKIYIKGNYAKVKDINELNCNEPQNIEFIGEIYSAKTYEDKRKRIVLRGGIGTYTSSVKFKAIECELMPKKLLVNDIDETVNGKKGKKLILAKIQGCISLDLYTHTPVLTAHTIELLKKEYRTDDALQKRVELHLHTNMSQADGIPPISEYVNLAKSMGHSALAITDHGVVQSFKYAQDASKKAGIKIIYGCELYVVNDKLNYIFNSTDIKLKDANYVCLDLETTGLSSRYDRIIEFGAVKINKNSLENKSIDILINPGKDIKLSKGIQELTHITDKDLADKKEFKDVYKEILDFIGDSIIVTHNTAFDITFLNAELVRLGLEELKNPVIDTLSLSRQYYPDSKAHNLEALSKRLGLTSYDLDKAHRADFDALVLSEVWAALKESILKNNPDTLHSDLGKLVPDKSLIRHLRPFHLTVYAKNKKGLRDLFELISLSHLDYFLDTPKVPRAELIKRRENLIIGSGCFNGELFDTAYTKNKKLLKKCMEFYDFVEIQPLTCYKPLFNTFRQKRITNEFGETLTVAIPMPEFENEDELIRTIKDIVEVADELNKKVVATGDVHYLNKEDKILREAFIATDGLGHRSHPLCLNPRGRISNHKYVEAGDQYYKTTNEMLDDFSYFGKEKAFEYVVTNSNFIASLCEPFEPVIEHLFTPHIENADENLRKESYDKAKELYGENLPIEITQRLEKELSRIIGEKASYAVNYLLAEDLVKKSNNDGFFVGSRGSVGSSFVAFLTGITEVNPLPPHYYCPHCREIIFVNEKDVISGLDLKEKKCPKCGTNYIRDGQNIPFETFLGFDEKTTKEPDIDLNFAPTYQPIAHQYLRDKFGENHTFRAGTIQTYKDKNAYACVVDYYMRSLHYSDQDLPRTQIEFLASKCEGVKRTISKHPGGIILIPKEYNVNEFTPIQMPSEKKEDDKDDNSWKTTHIEYECLHATLLKLDILAHLDPYALKLINEYTKFDFKKIFLGDPEVLSLFNSPKALNLKTNYLNLKVGTLCLPEFGTSFVRGVLVEANPQNFNDLLIISGLTHGTNVWLGNQDALLKNKIANKLSDIIGCRDDIMIYLMKYDVPNDVAFKVMEDVRKGKGIKPDYLAILKEKKIPSYFIDSCQKIKYLFPRAHATAYVTQAVRLGYYKIHFPLEFYAVFFETRCEAYDIRVMVEGEQSIILRLEEIRKKGELAKDKEIELIDTLEAALEMYERGYKFKNIDINVSMDRKFVVDKENKALIPPFVVVDGLGGAVASQIVKYRNEKAYTSVEDFKTRSHCTSANITALKQLGVFANIKEDDNISLFDFNF